MEQLIINVDDNLSGSIIETVSNRKGMLQSMNSENGLTTIEFEIPTRGLLGFRGEFILLTRGQGLCYSSFSHYGDYVGEIAKRTV
jgi:GTP-binding protein